MQSFMNEDFLLRTESACRLYHEYAEDMPIVDYHCHIDPKDIAEDSRYDSITELWLGGDHYKWRLIRANGVKEEGVTKAIQRDPYRLFQNFAAALPKAAGNPVYHWSHLELRRYFGIEKPLCLETAKEIYDTCNEKLRQPDMSVRGLIEQSKVRLICTTDDPIDNLTYHQKIKEDPSCTVKVLPAFRPDRALNLQKPDFAAYIGRLSDVSGITVTDFPSLCTALTARIDFFDQKGCRAADHGLDSCIYSPADEGLLTEIFLKAINGRPVSDAQAKAYKTGLLLHLGREYHRRGWVMQLHFGCMRGINARMTHAIGPDTGFDAVNGRGAVHKLSGFLSELNDTDELPRMVLYSLDPSDSEVIASVMGCFMADSDIPGKLQLGAPWWFNDHKSGMEKQLRDYANTTLLGNFIGMLTDSRSFLSYTRHEYFRRILCNFLGALVEDGEYPADFHTLGRMVQDICYHNTVRFFGFEV